MTIPPTQPLETQATEDGSADNTRLQMLSVVAAVLAIMGIVVLGLVLNTSARQGRPLYPNLPSPTPPARVINPEAETVTFRGLNENPAVYLNHVIAVTGDYTPLELPQCRPLAGPPIKWSLVADNLQLNALGFERVLQLVAPGTTMTVVGIWRLYNGPVGCGKEPPAEVVWYLEVTKIIAPNPLFGGPEAVLTFVPGRPTALVPATPVLDGTPEIVPTDGNTGGIDSTPPPETLPGIEPTIGATPTDLPLTPLATPGAPLTPLPTDEGPPTPNATIDPNATPTSEPEGTLTPGFPTSTVPPGGYPEPSPTSGSYP